jgi:hypothetical protein
VAEAAEASAAYSSGKGDGGRWWCGAVVAFEVVVVVVVVPADGHCDATCEDEEEEEEVDELAAAAAAVLGGPPVARCRSDEAALASVDEWWVGTAAAGKSEDKPKGCAGDGDGDSDVGNGNGQAGFDDAGDGGAVEADEIGGGKSDMSGNVRAPCGATGGIATKLWPWPWPWPWPGWAASFTRVALGTV